MAILGRDNLGEWAELCYDIIYWLIELTQILEMFRNCLSANTIRIDLVVNVGKSPFQYCDISCFTLSIYNSLKHWKNPLLQHSNSTQKIAKEIWAIPGLWWARILYGWRHRSFCATARFAPQKYICDQRISKQQRKWKVKQIFTSTKIQKCQQKWMNEWLVF